MQTAQRSADETSLVGLPPRQVNLVVIHCAATPSGKPVEQGDRTKPGYLNAPQVINAWHAARGFKRNSAVVAKFNPKLPSIGYHYVIDLDGTVWTGRHVDEIPAQAAGFNAHAIGICMIGGAERDGQFTSAQWKSLTQIVSHLLAVYGLPAAKPRRVTDPAAELGFRVEFGVCGHRDLSPDGNGNGLIESFEWVKTCPGFDVSKWLANGMRPEQKNIFQE